MTDRSKTVVMLIDWDNLQICHSRDAPGTELDLQALIALAQSYGTLVSARAYAEWNLLSERLAVYKAGIEPVFAPVMRPEGSPREGKSLADTVMVADGVDLLWTVAPDVFVLATSDKDMIPLARIAKQRGAAVVVLGSDLTAIPLVEMSNVFITYRQLLRELDRVTELEAPVGRAPARERRLRESRRPSSEPYGGGLGTNSGFGGAQIGNGGRGGPRAVGPVGAIGAPPAPAMPLPAPSAPRRRYPEPTPSPVPMAPIETERAPVVSASAVSAPTAPAAELPAEPLGVGAGDVTPRRRRRRGGRGRRSGIGGLGDGDLQGETLHDIVDDLDDSEAEDDEQAPAGAASGSNPDDIDNAVLQLLASRDREQSPSSVAEPASAEEAPSTTGLVTTASTEPASAEPEPARPRRTVRTSFSSFGPPEISFRPTTTPAPAQPAPVAAEPEPESLASSPSAASETVDTVSAAPGAPVSEAPLEVPEQPTTTVAGDTAAVTDGTAPETTVAETSLSEPIPVPAATDDAPQAFGAAVESGEEPAAASSTRSSRSSRSGRSGASGRGGATRRSRSTGSGAAASSTEAASGDSASEGAGQAPRRRRTRRPAGATAEGSGESMAASEASSASEASF